MGQRSLACAITKKVNTKDIETKACRGFYNEGEGTECWFLAGQGLCETYLQKVQHDLKMVHFQANFMAHFVNFLVGLSP